MEQGTVELSAADDDFHAPPDDSWWWHETCWFWFFVPERALGGWLYNWIRPNIGISGGGCWVWDDSAWIHWEVPYYANHSNLRLPPNRDLRDFAFPSRVRVRSLEPLSRYQLSYEDGAAISLDLEFDAIMEPWVSATSGIPNHFDQVGRVTGGLQLHGEHINVDCLAIRDRTWTLRSERWREGGGYGYTNATASPELGFLSVGHDRGYLLIDGERQAIDHAAREVERHREHGWITSVLLTARDVAGRELRAVGRPVSRMAMPIPGVHGVVWTSLVEWEINGTSAWGEDQEPWPIMSWSGLRR
jgi:hypothetical protein